MAMSESFPPLAEETPANGEISGGGGNRTRATFPPQCCGCSRISDVTITLASGRAASLCASCFEDMPRPSVYFVRSGELVKIGYSKNVAKRLSSLRSSSASPLELWHAEEGRREDEKELHWRFRADRSHGEWFHLSDAIVAYVEERLAA